MSQCYFTSLLFHIGFTCTYSKNTNSIYFYPHLSLPFSTKPFLPPSFYDCSHVTMSLCVVTAFQWEIADLFLTWSTHPCPSVTHSVFSSGRMSPILPKKHEPFLLFSIFHIKKSPQAIQLKLIHFRQSDHTAKVLSLSDAISRTERLN